MKLKYIPIFGLYWFFKDLGAYDEYEEWKFAIIATVTSIYHTIFVALIFIAIYGR